MQHWSESQRSLAIVVWPAFLAACLGTLLFFANINVANLADAFVFDVQLGHLAVYSIGFLFFWLVGLFAAALSTLMIRTERRRADFPIVPDADATVSHDDD